MRPDSRPKQSGVGPDRAGNVNPRESLGERFELKKLPLGLLDQETPSDLVVHYGAQVDLAVLPDRRSESGDNRGATLDDVCNCVGVQDEASHRLTWPAEARGEAGWS